MGLEGRVAHGEFSIMNFLQCFPLQESGVEDGRKGQFYRSDRPAQLNDWSSSRRIRAAQHKVHTHWLLCSAQGLRCSAVPELRGRRLTLQPRQPIGNTFFINKFYVDRGRCYVLHIVEEDALLNSLSGYIRYVLGTTWSIISGYSRGSFGSPTESDEVALRQAQSRRTRLQISSAAEGVVETCEFGGNASVVATNLFK
ncbi:hypothetical protein U1Q18_023943 [Sarracenia purpurea var. burkii]